MEDRNTDSRGVRPEDPRGADPGTAAGPAPAGAETAVPPETKGPAAEKAGPSETKDPGADSTASGTAGTADGPAPEKTGKKKKSGGQEKADELRKELLEQQNRYLRLMAEFDNYRKRTQREREAVYPDAVADTVRELLPLFDNFKRALETPCADENYAKGIGMIAESLRVFFEKLGVESFGEKGEPFDPNLHNAVMHVDDETLGKNVIAEVFESGYRIGGRILRHATVQQAN